MSRGKHRFIKRANINTTTMNPLSNKELAKYWVYIIREKKDDFRKYVSDPAIYRRTSKLGKKLKVLDCGCGEGYISRKLSKAGHIVTGIDLSPHLISAAIGKSGKRDKYLIVNMNKMPFKKNSFDAVVSNQVLMELKKPEIAIKEISRIIKPEGRFIFQVLHPFTENNSKSNTDYFKSKKHMAYFIVSGLKSKQKGIRYHHPLRRYTNALNKNGFKIICLDEPTPSKTTPKRSDIISKFKKPQVMIIDAEKTRTT